MAKKDKGTRLPKKVGGVKLPKQFRKSAGVLAELAQNPIAREVVSAALVAGATALAKRKVKGPEPERATGRGELDSLIAQGKDVGNLFAQGVTAFFGALLKPPEKAAVAPHSEPAAKPVSAKIASVKKPATAKRPAAKPAAATPSAVKAAPVRRRTKPAAKPKPAGRP